MIQEFAQIYGYKDIDFVTSAEEAIDILARKQYDHLVTDVGLPGLSGIDLVSLVEGYSHKIYFASDEVKRIRERYGDKYYIFKKPFVIPELKLFFETAKNGQQIS